MSASARTARVPKSMKRFVGYAARTGGCAKNAKFWQKPVLYPSGPRSPSMDGTSQIPVGRGAAGHVGRALVVHLGELGDPVDRPPVLREPRCNRPGSS